MRHPLLFFAALAALAPPLHAIDNEAGTTGFNFLKIGVGARPAALGGAFVAVPGHLEAPAWNPAGLVGIEKRSASLEYNSYLVDTQSGYLSLAFPTPRRVWGFSLNYFTYGDLQETNTDGQVLGSFGAFDLAAALTVAQKVWKGVRLGANFKAVFSSIDNFNSDAYMLDFGVLAPGPIAGMTLGASIANLGTVRSGFTGSFEDSLPVNLRLGFAHRPVHAPLPTLIVADLIVPNDNDPYLAFGVEFEVAGGFYLRPGFSTQQTGLEGDESLGLTGGAGFELSQYSVDYAFQSFPDLGDVHRFSISGSF